tara:strand:- start:187 stop:642 length:456 start_codon:yes stop_codon:yes gene_type:complete
MTEKSKKNIDTKPIKDLAKLLDELNLTEISYSDKEFSVSVSKSVNVTTLPQSNISSSSKDPSVDENSNSDYQNDPRAIKSPMVGTVYLQPEPGANKFINIGDDVKSGQTLLIIEAMKTMNPIESSLQGKVTKILVENEQAVEFGQPLVLVE